MQAMHSVSLTADVAHDFALLPAHPVRYEAGSDAEGVFVFPENDDPERMQAWCRLVCAKAVWGSTSSSSTTCSDFNPADALRFRYPREHGSAVRSCVLFTVPAMAALEAAFASSEILSTAVSCARRFLNAKTSFLSTLHDAWVLAGIERAHETGTGITNAVCDRMTTACTSLIMGLQARVAHITRYAQWVGINVPASSSSSSSLTLDYVFATRDGALHVCVLRFTGSGVTTGRTDCLRALAHSSLWCTQTDVALTSVQVLYPLRGESVVVNTTNWSASPLLRALQIGIPQWHVDAYVAFVHCTCSTATVWRPNAAHIMLYSTDEVWDAVKHCRRVVAWRYLDFAGVDRRYDDDIYELQATCALKTAEAVRETYLRGLETCGPDVQTVSFMKSQTLTPPPPPSFS